MWRIIKKGFNRCAKFDQISGMKMFQLSNPVGKNGLERWAGMEGSPYQYDVLLLDEAQDMNPAMLDVCLKQVKPKLVVGDSHQQIYRFRGAVYALTVTAIEFRVALNTIIVQY